ncbi:glycosyltransferase family 25 protein [Ascidiaceihabitans sp.]|uniref:glycosyltransferase family 25 protein n=1 Tax=Ascidiaceihabitans sp. TaxID=1872644 RepID=UPI00329A3AB6
MMQSLIIHMATAHARKANVETLCQTLPDAHVVDAQSGEECVTRPGDLHTPNYPFAMNKGEIGCTRSHRKCWQWIVDQDVEYALICEDDLSIDHAIWQQAMVLVAQYANADSFIRLPAKARDKPIKNIDTNGAARLFVPKTIGLQTVCQVVGKNAAKALLKATEELDRPVDTLLQMHWVHGQKIHTIFPNGVKELTQELGGSTIQKKTITGQKLSREIKRKWYRWLVASKPQEA